MKQVCVRAQVDDDFEKGCCFDCSFSAEEFENRDWVLKCGFGWNFEECKLEFED